MPLRFSHTVLWAVFVTGLILSSGGFLLINHFEELSVQQEQHRATDMVANALSNRIDINIDALLGIRGLFLASQKVDAEEFKIFSQVYLESNADIRALEWIPRVTNDMRLKFEQQVQSSGLSDYTIRERDSDGRMIVARTRQEYFPVQYVQPLDGNEKALGFDLASSVTRLTALKESAKSGKTIASASIDLIQDSAKQKGFVLFVPVYSLKVETAGSKTSSTLKGFALGVFHLGHLIDYALSGLEQETKGLTLSLVDTTDTKHPQLLYGPAVTARNKWQQQRSIRVAGRSWTVISNANAEYLDEKQDIIPFSVLFLGILLSVILTLYLRTLTQRSAQTAALVNKRTRDLEASESRNDLIVNEAADAVITINSDGRISTFNPAAENMFGYSAHEVMGKNVNVLMPEPYHSEHDGYLQHYRDTGRRHIIGIGREVTGQRKDGSTFPLYLSVGEGMIEDRPVFVGVLSDMTQRKQAEKSLIAAKEMAEEANRQKSIFLNMMSHELRTPLTVILGYLPIMKNKEKMPAPEVIAQIVSDMDLSGQHLLELINDLLDISKIEAGQMDLHKEQVSALDLIDEVLRKFKNQAQQAGIEVKIRVDEFILIADIKRLRQIFINLIGNALKFTTAGQIEIEGYNEADLAVFKVRDSGAGIPEPDLKYIFDAFKQADSSSTRSVGGTGLGLAITKRLVELHGGTITVESEPGQGSVFTFTLKQ